ncbi:hypothetical protein F9K94_15375 [Brucella tritici]|uniref:Uncharacterized protein n=1 Tax=Brucella tritici TaxID=94626 RepID=A0A7V7VS63_9HYPH|nr:hypothetical protein [Brucella tritici]KAB2655906.1 hypothetical protein F9K94_15375 [Brucella tritici]
MMHDAAEHPMGKYHGYAPSLIRRLQAQKKFLMGNSRRSQAHRLFRKGMDTVEIAQMMNKTEAEVEKLLHQARNEILGIEIAA